MALDSLCVRAPKKKRRISSNTDEMPNCLTEIVKQSEFLDAQSVNILKNNGINGTFFVLKHFVEKNTELTRKIKVAYQEKDVLLSIRNLRVYFHSIIRSEENIVNAVKGISYDVKRSEILGIVGESGCGKSVTAMSVMRLLQGPSGQIVNGSIRFKANDFKKDEKGKRRAYSFRPQITMHKLRKERKLHTSKGCK